MKQKFLNLSIILLCCFGLQGCILLGLAGATGAGAYFVGKKAQARGDERLRTESLIKVREEMEAKQKEVSAQDTNITNSINQKIVSGAISSQMAIYPEVKNGIVILHGRVPDSATAQRVIASAKQTRGVTQIISNLVVVNKNTQQIARQPNLAQFGNQRQIVPINSNYQNGNMQNQVSNSIAQQLMMQNAARQQQFRAQQPQPQSQQQYYQQQRGFQQYQNQQQPQYYQQQRVPIQPIQEEKIKVVPSSTQPSLNQTQNRRQINNQAYNNSATNKDFRPPPDNNSKPKTMSEDEMAKYYDDNDSSYVSMKPYLNKKKNIPASNNLPVYQPQNNNFNVNSFSNNFDSYQDFDSGYVPLNYYNPNLAPNPSIVQPIIEQPINIPTPDPAQDNDNTYEIYYY